MHNYIYVKGKQHLKRRYAIEQKEREELEELDKRFAGHWIE